MNTIKLKFNLNKIKLKKAHINYFALVRYFYPITIIIIIIVLGFFMLFLYNNVYQTIAQAEALTDLRKHVSDEQLLKENFEEIIENIEQKKQPTDIDFNNLKNPFLDLSVTPVVEQ